MKLKANQIRMPADVKYNRVDLTDRMKAVGIVQPLGPAGKQYLEAVYKKKHDEALAESVLIRAREEDHRSLVKAFQEQQKKLKATTKEAANKSKADAGEKTDPVLTSAQTPPEAKVGTAPEPAPAGPSGVDAGAIATSDLAPVTTPAQSVLHADVTSNLDIASPCSPEPAEANAGTGVDSGAVPVAAADQPASGAGEQRKTDPLVLTSPVASESSEPNPGSP